MLYDQKFFNELAKKVVPVFRQIIFGTTSGGKGAKMADGRSSYPEYSKGYKKQKRGKKIKRQDNEYAGSNAPVATGDLNRDFGGFQLLNKGFKFGTPTRGKIVDYLGKQGRFISTSKNPLPPQVTKMIEHEVRFEAEKWWAKNGGHKTHRINI